MCLLVAGEAGDGGEAPLQVLVRGDDVAHLAIVVLAVGHHVEVAGTGQADDDVLDLVVLLALYRLVNATRMAWLLSGAGRMPSHRANSSAASNTLVCSTLCASR